MYHDSRCPGEIRTRLTFYTCFLFQTTNHPAHGMTRLRIIDSPVNSSRGNRPCQKQGDERLLELLLTLSPKDEFFYFTIDGFFLFYDHDQM